MVLLVMMALLLVLLGTVLGWQCAAVVQDGKQGMPAKLC